MKIFNFIKTLLLDFLKSEFFITLILIALFVVSGVVALLDISVWSVIGKIICWIFVIINALVMLIGSIILIGITIGKSINYIYRTWDRS